MKSEIAEAFAQIVKEKNIDKQQLSEIVHSTVLGMIKKKFGSADNFDVYVHLDKGEIEIHQTRMIVDKVLDSVREVDVETAKKIEPDLEVGDEFLEILDPTNFGRRLIISAKQNLNQRIKDEEKRVISDEFENRIGEIVMGDVRQISRGDIFMSVDRTEAVLPKKEQIESERYRRGDHIRGIIKEVRRTSRGPEIIISRSDPQFLVRLFELEVPEIYDGIIEIKGVVRQPGERAKIAVLSNDKRIDAVGACVGMKGIRIQAISKELNNEKVDVIPWSSDREVFITRALSPSKPMRVLVDDPNNRAMAILPDDQVSLAIGRGGQNRRLTSRLTGVEIEIMKESEYRKMIEEERGKEVPLEYVEGLSQSMVGKLQDAGIQTVRDILKVGEEGLMQVKGIGEKTAVKIWALVQAREQTGEVSADATEEGEEEEETEAAESEETQESEAEPELAEEGPEEPKEGTAAEPQEESAEAPQAGTMAESEKDEAETMPQA
ncbi:MAG: transcription termination factor NusA [bacterium]